MSEQNRFSETFVSEARELLESVETSILDLEQRPEDKDAVDRLFRAMHTIKGSGAMFGFVDIADFTHHVETALDCVRNGRITVTDELIDLVLKSRDLISNMLDMAAGEAFSPNSNPAELIEELLKLVPQSARASMTPNTAVHTAEKVSEKPPQNAQRIYRIRFVPNADIFSTGMDPAYLIEDLGELGPCRVIPDINRIPPLDELDAIQCFISWDVILETGEPRDAIGDVFMFVEDDSVVDVEEITPQAESEPPKLGEILINKGDADRGIIRDALSKQQRVGEILVKEGNISPARVEAALEEQNVLKRRMLVQDEVVRVPSKKLDNLVNLVGELVISQSQLSRVANDMMEPTLSAAIEGLGRLTGRMRDVALNVRMVPIGTTFSRFRRLVRDLSKELKKEVEMVTEGEDTEIDKIVIDKLGDPLVHLIRNAIDHGIELPEERETKGKRRTGVIKLSAFHRGAKVIIRIEDDGSGLNTDAIRKKAIAQGLISKDVALAENDIHQLILAPGFSTAKKVSSISGRGVGMDVVSKEIGALRGSIGISSTPEEGSTIQLELPLTLAIVDGLLVDVAGTNYVIPIHAIRECISMTAAHGTSNTRKNMITFRDELIPIIRLREVFNYENECAKDEEEAVIVDEGGKRIGVVVDGIVEKQQIVIKPLGRLYKHVKGISGTTIMGNGHVALILDILSVVQLSKKASAQSQSALKPRRQARSARSDLL